MFWKAHDEATGSPLASSPAREKVQVTEGVQAGQHQEGRVAIQSLEVHRQAGPSTKDVEAVSSVAAEVSTGAAILAGQAQQLTHQQLLQQPDIQQSLSKSETGVC